MNDKGSSLVVVLLISLIFSVLGLAILAASVNNVKRTEIRELEVETTFDSKQLMSVVLARLQLNLNDSIINEMLKENEIPPVSPLSYDSRLKEIIDKTVSDLNSELKLAVPISIEELNSLEYRDYIGDLNIALFKEKNYTRIFKIAISYSGTDSSGPTITRNVTQNVILSPTPSFLQYAIGAYGKKQGTNDNLDSDDHAVVINGSPDIIGNVFAPTLELNSKAKFINNSVMSETLQFYGPSIFGTLFTSQVFNNRENYPTNAAFFEGNFEEKSDGMIGVPAIMPLNNDFIDMNFELTFNNKRIESGVPENTTDFVCSDPLYRELLNTDALIETNPSPSATGDLNIIINADEEIRDNLSDPSHDDTYYERLLNPKFKCGNDLYLIEESMLESYDGYTANLFNDIQNTDKTLYFTNLDKNASGQLEFKDDNKFVLNDSIDLKTDEDDKGWLVVDGTLEIVGNTDPDNEIVIEGNILVNGNLIIKSSDPSTSSNIYFDSTIYVNGESLLDNVNIYGASPTDPPKDQKQLVLMSNDDLKIVRINEFEDVSTEKKIVNRVNIPPNLKAFFYTDRNATLYGVGSLFEIEGGVFARQQLTINAIRYNFTSSKNIDEALTASSNSNPSKELNSRFYVEYDKKVITDQLSSLPRVNRLQVIPDQLFIK